MPFRRKRSQQDNPRQHIWNVYNEEKIIDAAGRVHIPRKFLTNLNVKAKGRVQIYTDWAQEIRIRKYKTQKSQQHVYEQSPDSVGKLLLPKPVRRKFSMNVGTKVLVSLCEGYNEIRLKKL